MYQKINNLLYLYNKFQMEDYYGTDFLKEFNPLTLHKLRLTNKLFSKTITNEIIHESILREINRRLTIIFDDKLYEFKCLLSETKAVISGSFIIQCMLDEYYENSDIDIYFPINNNKSYLTKRDFNYYEIEKFLWKTMNFKVKESYADISRYKSDQSDGKINIKWVRTYITSRNDIQVIQVKIDNNHDLMKDFINDTFDFDFCKNLYYVNNKKEYINIFKMNDVFNKIGNFELKHRLGSMIQRYKKYTERGFNISMNVSYEDIINQSKIKRDDCSITNGPRYDVFYIENIDTNKYKVIDRQFTLYVDEFITLGEVEFNGNIFTINKMDVCCDYCPIKLCKSDQKHICFHHNVREQNIGLFIIK